MCGIKVCCMMYRLPMRVPLADCNCAELHFVHTNTPYR